MDKNLFIESLINKTGESGVEFLPDFRVDDILKIICSFLNTEGGWIVVGHSGKELIGIPDVSDIMIEGLMHNINLRIIPIPLVNIESIIYQKKKVALISVLRGPQIPYQIDRIFYIRTSNEYREADAGEISRLLRLPAVYSWEKFTTVDATFEDLDIPEIERTILDANRTGRAINLPNNLQEFISFFQLSDYSNVKNGAVVLFGKEPAKHLSQCRIKITVVPEGKTADRIDLMVIESNLFDSFRKINQYFEKMPSQYPMDALREGIVNAMIHRDYGDMSGEIAINYFNNRIEIINSGEIPSKFLKGKNNIKIHPSVLRNPAIAHMFFLRGNMERLGKGLTLIVDRFKDLDLRLPEWSTQNGYTTLRLFNTPKPISKPGKNHK